MSLEMPGMGGADAVREFLDKTPVFKQEAPEPAAPAVEAKPAEAPAPVAEVKPDIPAPEAQPAAPAAPDAITPAIEEAAGRHLAMLERVQAAERAQRDAEARLEDARASAAAEGRKSVVDSMRGNVHELVKAMQEAGWDADSFVAALMANDPKKPDVVRANQLEQRIQAQEAELRRLREEQVAREQTRQIEDFKAGVVPQLSSKKDEYSHLLAMFEPADISAGVVQEMQRLYQSSGGTKNPTIFEAAASLESQLRARVSRIKAPQTVNPAPAPNAPAPAAVPPVAKPKTLTNELSPAPDSAPDLGTDEARYRAAAAILVGSNLGFSG